MQSLGAEWTGSSQDQDCSVQLGNKDERREAGDEARDVQETKVSRAFLMKTYIYQLSSIMY